MRRRSLKIRDAGRIGMDAWRKLYGSPPANVKASNVRQHAEAEDAEQRERQNSPTIDDAAQVDPSIAKFGAVALYAHHLLPLERVQALFDAHPEWRHA